jgi:hypothetical protein
LGSRKAHFFECDHGQQRWDGRDNEHKEHVAEQDYLDAPRITSVPQRSDERFRKVFAEPDRLYLARSPPQDDKTDDKKAQCIN